MQEPGSGIAARGWAHLGALGAPLEVQAAEMALRIWFLTTDSPSVMAKNSHLLSFCQFQGAKLRFGTYLP